MEHFRHVIELRVRYCETDQMGSYYNSRALEWFECGRSELLRAAGKPYRDMEAEGLLLPVTEAHVEYFSPAPYDELLSVATTLSMAGRARLRFAVDIHRAHDAAPVCRGYTIHAVTDRQGKPIRPPQWLSDLAGGHQK